MVNFPLQEKRKHLRKERRKKDIWTYWTGFICWRMKADEASPPADEAIPPANEASPFGPYIFKKFAPYFFLIVYFSLFFYAQKYRITPLQCPCTACSVKIQTNLNSELSLLRGKLWGLGESQECWGQQQKQLQRSSSSSFPLFGPILTYCTARCG